MVFERALRKTRPIPLTSLIDIMFFLLLFFMLSTSFVRNESLELTLPSNATASAKSGQKLTQVYVNQDGMIYLGRDQVSEEKLIKKLREVLLEHPNMNIVLLSGPKVTMQQMITAMDRIYIAGAKNLSVSSWEPEKLEVVKVVEPYANMGGRSGH
jgi:biopolymer transport protein ExbD